MHAEFESCRHATHIGKLIGHNSPITSLAWSPDGEWLASCSSDGMLNLWSTIRAKTRPRFSFRSPLSPPPRLTSVAWSPDGVYVACGTTAGWLDVWEADSLRPVSHRDDGARATITSVAWSPATKRGDLRLAFGAQDGHVHFRNYADWDEPDVERGIGHDFPIERVVWARDGALVVTGTRGGTIGVWAPSDRDNQLRVWLTSKGIHAHAGAIRTLACCTETGILASGAKDGVIRLWDLEAGCLLAELPLKEEIVDLQFAHKGQLLVVHSRDHIHFVRARPLQPIESYYYPAALDPAGIIAVNAAGQVAVSDPDDRSHVAVWQVDFGALLQLAQTTGRSYRSAAVSLLGESGSGRTNLALALVGGPFVPEPTAHDFRVHRLPVRADGHELQEVALWDLPTRVDHALIHRMHAGDGAVALMVLAPRPGLLATAEANLERWRHTLRRWNTLSRGAAHPSIVVITRCDELRAEPTAADAAVVAAALDVERVFFTSAKTDAGIVELRNAVIAAIDWNATTAFPSVEVLHKMVEYVHAERAQKHFLTSVRDLFHAFLREHPYAGKHVTTEEIFRRGVQLLEVLGAVELFERRNEVLLDPDYYHAYASAMIAGAERDEKGMGRLRLLEAEQGRGEQMELPQAERILDVAQEARLLHLTITDLVASGVAQIVATDGVSHLVFPIALKKDRPVETPRLPKAIGCSFEGETHQIFSSLIVRLLGLENHYPTYQLWKNAATFGPAAGGNCELILAPTKAGDEADLSIGFDAKTSDTERRLFTNIVTSHVREQARRIKGMDEPVAEPVRRPDPGGEQSPEVYFCWAGAEADVATADNVRTIAQQLQARGIRTVGDPIDTLPGDTADDRLAVLERMRVALLLLAGPLSRRQEIDYGRLLAAGCRVIPVILPNARKTVKVPEEVRRTVGADFRGRFLVDLEPLAKGIVEKWRLGPAQPRQLMGGVFLSYSRTDYLLVERLREELQAAGHQVWYDADDADLPPGTFWQDRIREAIHRSYAFIWCLSEISVMRSQSWMYPEVSEAIRIQQTLHPSRVFIIPVRLAECEVPDMRIDAVRSLRDLQRFDYFDTPRIGELVRVLDSARHQAAADLTLRRPRGHSRDMAV